jgi:hypothetical protein
MASIQITPTGLGQTMMIAAVAIGAGLIIDACMFMSDKSSLLGYFNIGIALEERSRAVLEIGAGILLAMFGIGLWTVQVGGIAIIALLCLTLGQYWTINGSRGSAHNTQIATVSTPQAAARQQKASTNRYECPLGAAQLKWCDEDTDGDGTINRYDKSYNKSGQAIRNCRFRTYITAMYSKGCKAYVK